MSKIQNFSNKDKFLINDKEVQSSLIDIFENCLGILSGNPVSVLKLCYTIYNSPVIVQNKIFLSKFERFLSGMALDENERLKLSAKLVEDGNKGDNPYRLLEAINRADTLRKIDFLRNASRALLAGFINLTDYFRICNIISNTLEEDLLFLSENLDENQDFEYNDTIQGLLNFGLMYQSVIDSNGDNRYKFTPIAYKVDKYAISFDNVEKYPLIGKTSINHMLKQKVNDLNSIPIEDIDKITSL